MKKGISLEDKPAGRGFAYANPGLKNRQFYVVVSIEIIHFIMEGRPVSLFGFLYGSF